MSGLDHPDLRNRDEASESARFYAATLHCFGLSYQYAKSESLVLPEVCACCNAPLWDRSLRGSRAKKIFAWHCHTGRCGGDGRRLHAHDKEKFALKKLILSNPNPGGYVFPAASIVIELEHLRQDKSRPGEIVALGRGAFLTLVTSGTTKTGFKILKPTIDD